jgi:hypothetical protein
MTGVIERQQRVKGSRGRKAAEGKRSFLRQDDSYSDGNSSDGRVPGKSLHPKKAYCLKHTCIG